MGKTKRIYSVYVIDDRYPGGRCVAYCETKELAVRELENHRDENGRLPQPDDYHIREIEMIVG